MEAGRPARSQLAIIQVRGDDGLKQSGRVRGDTILDIL